jgi:hypothetical protein
MAGFTVKLAVGGMLAGVVLAGRADGAPQEPAPARSAPTLPQFTPPPRMTPPVQLAPSQRQPPGAPPPPNWLPPRFPQEQPLNPKARPPLPEIWVDPYVVCGTTIIPAPPNVDPRFAQPLPERSETRRQAAPLIRRVRPGICTTADARPLNPVVPRIR